MVVERCEINYSGSDGFVKSLIASGFHGNTCPAWCENNTPIISQWKCMAPSNLRTLLEGRFCVLIFFSLRKGPYMTYLPCIVKNININEIVQHRKDCAIIDNIVQS